MNKTPLFNMGITQDCSSMPHVTVIDIGYWSLYGFMLESNI